MTWQSKLREGTEVLRTGGGATLTAEECNAALDYLAALEKALYRTMSGWLESEGRPTTHENVQRQVDDAIRREH